VVSDTGGKAEVLGHSFAGPTHCTKYGGPFGQDQGLIEHWNGTNWKVVPSPARGPAAATTRPR